MIRDEGSVLFLLIPILYFSIQPIPIPIPILQKIPIFTDTDPPSLTESMSTEAKRNALDHLWHGVQQGSGRSLRVTQLLFERSCSSAPLQQLRVQLVSGGGGQEGGAAHGCGFTGLFISRTFV